MDSLELAVPTPPEQFRFMDRQRLIFRLLRRLKGTTKKYARKAGALAAAPVFPLLAEPGADRQTLVAGLFDQTVAARSIVDDNFAWELWDLGASHLHQKASSDLIR